MPRNVTTLYSNLLTDWLNYAPPIDPVGLTPAEFGWAVEQTAAMLARLTA